MQPWKFLFLLISLYLQINKSITSSTSTTTILTTEVSASTTASTTSTTIPVTTTPPTTQETTTSTVASATTTSTVASATTTSTTTTSNVANVTTTSITTTSTTESTTISTTQAPIQPGKSCNSTIECVANATCTNATCTNANCSSTNATCECDNSFYPNANRTLCAPRKLLGENCDDTTLCIHNASCSASGTCNCNESYYNNSGTCNERASYNATCVTTDSCQVQYNCSSIYKLCLCPSNTFRNSSECVNETLLLVQNIRNNTDYMERNISIVWDRLANFSDPPIEYEVILNNGSVDITNNSFAVFTDLTPGTQYSVKVTARRRKDIVGNEIVQGPPQVKIFYTRPSVPDKLLQFEYPGPDVNVTFNKTEGRVNEYNLTLSNGNSTKVTAVEGIQSVQFSNLIEGDTYNVTIISMINRTDRIETISAKSNPLPFKVQAGTSGPVEDLKSNKSGTSWIHITWSKPQSPRGKMIGYLLGVLDTTNNKSCSVYEWQCADCSTPRSDPFLSCRKNIANTTLKNLLDNAIYPFSTNVTDLESDKNYTLRVYTYNEKELGDNSFITARTNKEDSPQTSGPNVGAIVGGVIGGLAFIAIVVVIIFFIRRSRWVPPFELIGKRRDTGLPRLIKLRNFAFRLEQLHKDSNRAFMEEFQNLQDNSPDMYDFDAAMIDDNKGKNRYVNILPYEHTRVKLSTPYDDPVRNFINANYVPGYSSPREYIATQGPMMSTINDFWRMIWEQNACIIVMLSDLTEKGRPKVELYWPKEPNTPTDYGDITVEMTACSQIKSHTIRTFQVSKEDESRQILQYFLPGWEDYDANLSPEDILDFIQAVRKQATSEAKSEFAPIIIHCSAGVGRTGTYIALDFLMQFVDERNDLEAEVDIFNLVLNLRHHRPMMVQSEKQYIFIYDAMKVIVERKVKAMQEEYNENVYQNTLPENIYANEAFVPQEENLYENTDKLHRETTAL